MLSLSFPLYRYITNEMRKIDEIFIVGSPEVSVIAIGR